jgi:DNA repair exonuclease SbcCD ATPase subunit
VLSSKNDEKQEARFAARLDVLLERMDTLGSTVATTASSMAKKDGEIAALRRDLEARDQTLQALVAQVRQNGPTSAGTPDVDANELRLLRNAVAALTKERATAGNVTQLEDLATRVRALSARVEDLAAAVDARSPERPSEELVAMLGTLRSQVEALGGLNTVSEEQLGIRFVETDNALSHFAQRLDTLAETVEEAAASLGEKEDELAALHRHFTESSSRIESIVEDIRGALHAFGELDSTAYDELTSRVERIETATREASEARDRGGVELARRVDRVDQRVAAVTEEVARAKTLWPVALRSLEARLEDVVHARRAEPVGGDAGASPVGDETSPDEPPEDLLAELRDSLQAMESVAAEMARASETLGDPVDEPVVEPSVEGEPDEEPSETTVVVSEPSAAVAGATVVPLRASEP